VYRLILLYIISIITLSSASAQSQRAELESLLNTCNALLLNEEDSLALAKLNAGLRVSIASFGKNDTTTAKMYHRAGVANHNLYELENAIENYKSALGIRNKLLSKDHPSIAELHYLLGVYFFDSDINYNSDSTIYHLNKAISIQQKNPSRALGKSYRMLAQHYLYNSDAFNALNYFNSAKAILTDKASQADLHILIADVYTDLNEPDSIYKYLTKSKFLYESTQLGNYTKLRLIDCYTRLASYYTDESDYKNARTYLLKARSILEESDDYDGLAALLINLGVVEKRENNFFLSNNALEEALVIYEEEFPNTKLSDKGIIHHNLGDNKMLLGESESAILDYQKASENFLENYKAVDLYSVPNIKSEVFISNKNNLLLNFQQLIKAHKKQHTEYSNACVKKTYMAIDQVIAKMRQEQVNEDSKLLWREKTKPIYEQMLSSAFAHNDAEFAYQIFEKSKSVILLDALKDETALQIANVPVELTEKLQTAEAEISELELNIQDYEDRNEVIDALHNLYTKKQQIVSQLEKTYPQYYNYKYNSDFITIEKLRETLLHPQKGLIQYFVGEQDLYSIYVTTSDIQLHRTKISDSFNESIASLLRLLSDKNKLEYKDSYAKYDELRIAVHEILLAPFKELASSLIIIPDGIINNIPFEVLGSSKNTDLIDQHNISYGYSCNVLEQNNIKKSNRKQLAFFAPLEYSHSGLSALKSGEKDAKSLNKILDLQHFIGKVASVDNFRKNCADYNILHLSTHAQASDSLANKSWIAFADSLLYLDQIYSLPIHADLIVLSACQTSLGDLIAGEGVMSLARAFTYAGAASSLTSLWEVNEQATQEIIQLFYEQIIAGKSKSEALQQAKLTYRSRHTDASPHYWSGFILLGNPGPIDIGVGSNSLLFGGIAVLGLLGLFVFSFMIKSNRQ